MKSVSKISAVIVDDEPLARQIVREYLGNHPDVEIVAECSNGFEAVKAVTELQPELLFLDIQMPKLSGFEVLQLIDRDLAVVFTTAYDEFALKAFEVHASDYLLKPFSRERFDRAMSQVRKRLSAPQRNALEALVEESRRATAPLERVLIRDGAKVHIVPTTAIDYVEAQDDYVSIKAGGKSYLKQGTLSGIETQLDPLRFVRIHRSYILNIERLSKIEPYAKDSRVAILTNGIRLPLSRSGFAKLKQHL